MWHVHLSEWLLVDHYAPGTRQNLGAKPCVNGQPQDCAGRYWLRLFARDGARYWNTRDVRNGRYVLSVTAWDAAGNSAQTSVRVTVRN